MGEATVVSALLFGAGVAGCDRSRDFGGAGSPDPLVWATAYDAGGRLQRLDGPGGRFFKLTYGRGVQHPVRELTVEASDATSVAVRFASHGRRIGMTDSSGLTQYTYDAQGRTVRVSRQGSLPLAIRYDEMGRRVSLQLGAGLAIRYAYDFMGRLAAIETPAGRITYRYDCRTRKVQRMLPNGVLTVRAYRWDGALVSFGHERAERGLLRQAYAYRPDGRLLTLDETGATGSLRRTYAYDLARRLASVDDSRTGRSVYRYDHVGNLVEARTVASAFAVASYDFAGRMVSRDGQPCRHDAAGNVESYPGCDLTWTYDAWNRLRRSRGPSQETAYVYDGDGLLAEWRSGSNVWRFLPDPAATEWRPLAAISGNGEVKLYVWDGAEPVAEVAGTETRFFLTDYLGSVRMVTNPAGEVVERVDYAPFGMPLTAPTASRLYPGFAGMFFDPSAGIYVAVARAYDPRIGRFLQPSPHVRVPTAETPQAGGYVYCGNDPVNFGETQGTEARWAWGDGSAFWSGIERPEGLTEPSEASAAWMARISGDSVSSLGLWDARPSSWWAHGGWSGANRDPWPPEPADAVAATTARLLPGTHWRGERVPASARPGELQAPVPSGVPGPFGGASPREAPPAEALAGDRSLRPSLVGSTYVCGPQSRVEGIGQIAGLALDPGSRRLVLLGENHDVHGLPTLRMDDLVTVFRAVYERNETPFVSIDPDPAEPDGPTMVVRHDSVTPNTYVGWVLFQADRIMKRFSLGMDNETQEPVTTHVGGYRDLLQVGREEAADGQREEEWNRFWIVPSSVNRRDSTTGDVTLVDVALKVKTERMTLSRGRLIPAASAESSSARFGGAMASAAQRFADWFTTHFREIGEEVLLPPPPGTGIETPVRIYEELRRISRLAVLAETLRARDVPMPDWMRDYAVRPTATPARTPAIVVAATTTNTLHTSRADGEYVRTTTLTRRIYGGVSLAPNDRDMRVVASSPAAEGLVGALRKTAGGPPPVDPVVSLGLVQSVRDGKAYRAVAVPLADTRGPLALQLDEVDVTLPVTRDAGIPLVRHFDSFRKPSPDTLGASWSWELPRLRKISRTIRRDEKGAHCVDGCELDWPGQGAPTLFRKAVFDPETRSQLMLPEGGQSAAITGLTSMQDARLGQRTDAVLFRDGRSWHFDVQGMLVAQYAPPRRMILRRGLDGTIRKVEGWNGDRRTSEAALGYDAEGKLTNIRTSDGQEVRYAYDDARRLVDVSGPQRRRRYQYDERGLVRSIEADGRQVTSFEYDDRGRVTRVVRPDGETVDYRAKPDGDRLAVTATGPGGTEVVHYGPDMRVLDRVTTDGTRVEWSGTAAEPRVRVHASDGENRTYTREPRPGGCAWRQEDAIQRVTSYDNNGRLVAIERDGQEVARFSWRPDGQLAAAVCEGASWAPQYRADGVQVGMRLAPAALPSTWFETTYDDAGRVVGSLDSEGVRTLVTRETNGWVRAYQAGTSGGDAVRLDVTRDPRGRLARVEDADGGWRSVSYTEGDRVPNRIEWSRQGASACLDFDRGFPWRLRWFDGAVWKAELDRAPGTNALIGLMKGPAGLRVEYGYDAQRRLARVISGPVYAMDIEYDPAGRVARVTQRPGSPSRRWWRRP